MFISIMKYEDFNHTTVPGDGSCFFHSLATIILVDETGEYPNKHSVKTKAKLLRKECIKWLQNNLDYKVKGTGLTIRSEIEEDLEYNENQINETIKDYLNYMKTSDGYAGQIEIYAMANILNRSIRVYIHNKDKFSNSGLGYQLNTKKDIMKDIFIYHNLRDRIDKPGLHHFDPLYPKVKLKKEVKEVKEKKKKEYKKSVRRKASPSKARRSKARRSKATRSKARSKARRSKATRSKARRKARRSKATRSKARRSKASPRRTNRRTKRE